MSLSNILVPNLYNLYSNSQTFNLNSAQPIAGNNTLWINSANNHLYRDGVDLENFAPVVTTATYWIPPSGWDIPQSSSIGIDYDLHVPYITIDLTASKVISCMPNQSHIPTGLKLSSFDLVYSIDDGIDPNTSSIQLEYVTFISGNTQTQSPIPITGTLQSTPSPGVTQYVSTFTITNPITLGNDQTLLLSLELFGTNPGASFFYIYGAFMTFTA